MKSNKNNIEISEKEIHEKENLVVVVPIGKETIIST